MRTELLPVDRVKGGRSEYHGVGRTTSSILTTQHLGSLCWALRETTSKVPRVRVRVFVDTSLNILYFNTLTLLSSSTSASTATSLVDTFDLCG